MAHSDHDHSQHHSHAPTGGKKLLFVIAMTAVIFLAELIGGLLSGSLALLADAGHMLSDSAGLVIAGIAMAIGTKSATRASTYGFRRAEVLAAAVNAISVAAIAIVILIQALRRLGDPADIHTTAMASVAVIGLVANIIAAVILHGSAQQSMNLKGAYLHVLADLMGSVAVIVAAIIIATTGWQWADTVASIIIVAIIIPRAWQLLAQAGRVLMEQVPAGVDTAAIQRDIEALPGVIHAHDLHVWSVGGQDLVATVHVVADDGFLGATPPACSLLDSVQGLLRDRHSITHATVQIEHPGHAEHESGVC
ncbi:MAG TPA: cation diffusion facilitator family transporter [Candidatus Corynebacterium gallistercoris]|uniref:Cation diffusion facilitator family transporter n=1 Tax=Candidatus Corynebacterium gallistercoris TaxID=2838530 RepID=A0A9D1URU3_9CORY|nr:cation diffusion facilitator family transporter [Candidatus Corynebacterium gallistercoris]